MKKKACNLCGEKKLEKDFGILGHHRLSACFSCSISELKSQQKTGRTGPAARYRRCRHCRRRKRIECFPSRSTTLGFLYRSFTCQKCCERGLEWAPSKAIRKTLNAQWLDDPQESAEERDEWLENLARSISMQKMKEDDS